jgi:hypothetical protein
MNLNHLTLKFPRVKKPTSQPVSQPAPVATQQSSSHEADLIQTINQVSIAAPSPTFNQPILNHHQPIQNNVSHTVNQQITKSAYDSLAPLNLPSKPIVYVSEQVDSSKNGEDARQDERAKLESILLNSMGTYSTSSNKPAKQLNIMQHNQGLSMHQPHIQPTRTVPSNYRCPICKKTGHSKNQCPEASTKQEEQLRHKFPSGIPKKNLIPAKPGDTFAMLGPDGYVVEQIEHQASLIVKKEKPAFFEEDDEESQDGQKQQQHQQSKIPPELKCPYGDHIIKDAILVPCCGHFVCCDECIRQRISNDEHVECPHEGCDQEIGSLISITPYHEIRKKVNDYLNEMKLAKQNAVAGVSTASANKSSDPFFDLILNEVGNEKTFASKLSPKSEETNLYKVIDSEKPASPLQDSKISSSEIQPQAQTGSSVTLNVTASMPIPQPALLPNPPSIPPLDNKIRPSSNQMPPFQLHKPRPNIRNVMPMANNFQPSQMPPQRPSFNMQNQPPYPIPPNRPPFNAPLPPQMNMAPPFVGQNMYMNQFPMNNMPPMHFNQPMVNMPPMNQPMQLPPHMFHSNMNQMPPQMGPSGHPPPGGPNAIGAQPNGPINPMMMMPNQRILSEAEFYAMQKKLRKESTKSRSKSPRARSGSRSYSSRSRSYSRSRSRSAGRGRSKSRERYNKQRDYAKDYNRPKYRSYNRRSRTRSRSRERDRDRGKHTKTISSSIRKKSYSRSKSPVNKQRRSSKSPTKDRSKVKENKSSSKSSKNRSCSKESKKNESRSKLGEKRPNAMSRIEENVVVIVDNTNGRQVTSYKDDELSKKKKKGDESTQPSADTSKTDRATVKESSVSSASVNSEKDGKKKHKHKSKKKQKHKSRSPVKS